MKVNCDDDVRVREAPEDGSGVSCLDNDSENEGSEEVELRYLA